MTRRILVTLMVASLLITGALGVSADELEYEPIYYNDELYLAINPGGHSANPNQFTFGCFNLGPNLNGKPHVPSIPIYAVLWEGASQHSCPDGSFAHDHVATAIPGTPGFVPHWKVIFIIPVSDTLQLPLTSAEAVEAAIAAGQVVVVDTGLIINAPVVRRSGE